MLESPLLHSRSFKTISARTGQGKSNLSAQQTFCQIVLKWQSSEVPGVCRVLQKGPGFAEVRGRGPGFAEVRIHTGLSGYSIGFAFISLLLAPYNLRPEATPVESAAISVLCAFRGTWHRQLLDSSQYVPLTCLASLPSQQVTHQGSALSCSQPFPWAQLTAAARVSVVRLDSTCEHGCWRRMDEGNQVVPITPIRSGRTSQRSAWLTIPACSSLARTLVPTLSLFSVDGLLGSICKHGGWHHIDVCDAGVLYLWDQKHRMYPFG